MILLADEALALAFESLELQREVGILFLDQFSLARGLLQMDRAGIVLLQAAHGLLLVLEGFLPFCWQSSPYFCLRSKMTTFMNA